MSADPSNSPVLPPTYFFIALAGQVALHFLIPIVEVIWAPWRYAGVVPITAGVALSIHGSRMFDRRGTTVKPFQEPSVLVVDGAYRYTRNPMYLGMVAILAGAAIAFGTVTPWLVVIVFVPIISRRFILDEEASLHRAFGEQYEAYRRSVRRWI